MRFTFAIVALTSALAAVSAQSIPACATPCLANANLGGCAATDNACLCKNQAFISSTTACIQANCTGSDLTNAEAAAQALCAAVGVTLTPPASTGSASHSAAPSSTAPSSASPRSTAKSGAVTYGINAVVGLAAVALSALAL
ncbi:hypothetical protein JAAARDRAFT_36030 [Jaapia argillacea MUCL 33604]|uniref:CFEM domain-containing protein n=1 Tax=Jaapia argillacea MUCL 33604 TaxID=933084 RepID=A0A067PZ59_9AGAM|nr:hypothetical protein JAAARDRAFT_36030 [Jaapia argillacea MUCL 33604]